MKYRFTIIIFLFSLVLIGCNTEEAESDIESVLDEAGKARRGASKASHEAGLAIKEALGTIDEADVSELDSDDNCPGPGCPTKIEGDSKPTVNTSANNP